MLSTKTIIAFPPEMKSYFDRMLLFHDAFKFGDETGKIHKMFAYIKSESEKFRKFPEIYARWQNLEKQYLDLYERTKIKEKKQSPKAKNKTKRPFYHITMPDQSSRDLFLRLRFVGN